MDLQSLKTQTNEDNEHHGSNGKTGVHRLVAGCITGVEAGCITGVGVFVRLNKPCLGLRISSSLPQVTTDDIQKSEEASNVSAAWKLVKRTLTASSLSRSNSKTQCRCDHKTGIAIAYGHSSSPGFVPIQASVGGGAKGAGGEGVTGCTRVVHASASRVLLSCVLVMYARFCQSCPVELW